MADRAQKTQKESSPAAGTASAAKDPYTAQGQQPPATLLLRDVTPEVAINEFAQITSAINVGGFQVAYVTSTQGCPEENAKWCLPDVNCTARVTMDEGTRKAFTANRVHCGRETGPIERQEA
jgi:hypothetical protein